MDDDELIAARTRVATTELLPEVPLHVAAEILPLWLETARKSASDEVGPPPYWGFPWLGGQALARYVLDHPELVRDRRVLDVGTGSGLVAIAAARAGAASVVACDVDPIAIVAARRNAALNGVALQLLERDLLGETESRDEEVILAGDVFYEQALASAMFGFLRRHAATGALVLIGDPGRAYFDAEGIDELARYDVATTTDLEGSSRRSCGVFRITSPTPRGW